MADATLVTVGYGLRVMTGIATPMHARVVAKVVQLAQLQLRLHAAVLRGLVDKSHGTAMREMLCA